MNRPLWPVLASCLAIVAGCSAGDDSAPPGAGEGADGGGVFGGGADGGVHVQPGDDGGSASSEGGTGGGSGDRPDGSTPPAPCADACPAAKGGIAWGCEKRFLFGINYAWRSFGADFGGISAWKQAGISTEPDVHARNLADMAAHGAGMVRWWILPDMRGDAVQFDGNDAPTGLGGTTIADVQKALELADQANVYLMLTVFSFDGFRPTSTVNGLKVRGLAPILHDPAKRDALLTKVVRPLARAVESSPHRKRVVAWDVINEPEWAMTGHSPYGDPDYTPTVGLDTLTHAEMEAFVKDTIGALRSESHALVTVGSAAVKWAHAWTKVGVDFYQFHYYDWINRDWPYTNKPSTYGLDKPLVIGEFPVGDLAPGAPYSTVVESFYQNGYAGALGWAYDGAAAGDLAHETDFARAHTCDTRFDTRASTLARRRAPAADVGVGGGALTPENPNVRVCRRGADGVPTCADP